MCLDQNEDGSDVRDGADVRAVANRVAYLEFHALPLRPCERVAPRIMTISVPFDT
jgi:hypothetical protein